MHHSDISSRPISALAHIRVTMLRAGGGLARPCARTVIQLPFAWPQSPPRRPRRPAGPATAIVQLVKRKPWLAVRLLGRDIPEPRDPRAG